MYSINEDLSIYATRGDIVVFSVAAEQDGKPYEFQPGDTIRITIYGKKDAETVYLVKDFFISEVTEKVEIYLTKEDTKIGEEVLSKPKDYWYEITLNPTEEPQTIVGYDEDGAKIFKLFPEGDATHKEETSEDNPIEDIPIEDRPFVDDKLDWESTNPVQNKVITMELERISGVFDHTKETVETTASALEEEVEQFKTEITNSISELDTSISTLATQVNSDLKDTKEWFEESDTLLGSRIDGNSALIQNNTADIVTNVSDIAKIFNVVGKTELSEGEPNQEAKIQAIEDKLNSYKKTLWFNENGIEYPGSATESIPCEDASNYNLFSIKLRADNEDKTVDLEVLGYKTDSCTVLASGTRYGAKGYYYDYVVQISFPNDEKQDSFVLGFAQFHVMGDPADVWATLKILRIVGIM